jgi:hypothetical protein
MRITLLAVLLLLSVSWLRTAAAPIWLQQLLLLDCSASQRTTLPGSFAYSFMQSGMPLPV